jgi:hypothetical protein
MTRIKFLAYFAKWIVLREAFREHCKAEGIDAAKATTDELRAFAAMRGDPDADEI